MEELKKTLEAERVRAAEELKQAKAEFEAAKAKKAETAEDDAKTPAGEKKCKVPEIPADPYAKPVKNETSICTK